MWTKHFRLWMLLLSYHTNRVFLNFSCTLFRRRSSPGACLPSSSSPHLSLLSRPGVNPLQSSGSGPYLNTVSFHLPFSYPSAASNSNIAAIILSSSANIIPVLIWHYLCNLIWLFCPFIHTFVLSLSLFFCLILKMASLSLHFSFFCVCFLCVSVLPLPVCMCVCVVILQFGAFVCIGQMPFPPEYLAPPAERMKKERKTKTPKNKKETTGKVREEKGKIRCSDDDKNNNNNADILLTSHILYSIWTCLLYLMTPWAISIRLYLTLLHGIYYCWIVSDQCLSDLYWM